MMQEAKTAIVVREIAEALHAEPVLDQAVLNRIKKDITKKHGYKRILTNIQILSHLPPEDAELCKDLLITKPTRTISGVTVVAIMTMPLGCPHGKCIFCPGGPRSPFGDVPQSYTGNEPATMRAIRNQYDAYLQIFNRLEQYVMIGQNPEKVELIIMGGTFPSYPKKYKTGFVTDCYRAMNDFSRRFYPEGAFDLARFKEFFFLPGDVADPERTGLVQERILELKKKNEDDLAAAQEKNESSRIRCVGMTIETKPDWGKLDIGNEILDFGATRVELGIQTVYDDILEKTHRGHSLADSKESIRVLKDLGFKLNFHMMPGLPGVTKAEDITALQRLFSDPDFRPDMLKIYPTMVFPGTPLAEETKKGLFTPITTQTAAEIIAEFKKDVPRYCRIMRVQRDIPTRLGEGVDRNNLRQYIDRHMNERGIACQCIRCREIRGKPVTGKPAREVIPYEASRGKEFFISLKDEKDRLLGFVRLRFPSQQLRAEITPKTALIRELHVYGIAAGIGEAGRVQHKGLGRRLMEEAEAMARRNGKDRMVVISGVGVRGYYQKLGYRHDGPYMAKDLA